MENDRFAMKVYAWECASSRSVGRPRKRWIDMVKDCLHKIVWMSGKQREWCMVGVNGRICEEECMGRSLGAYKARRVAVCMWSSLLLKGIKGNYSFILFYLALVPSTVAHFMS